MACLHHRAKDDHANVWAPGVASCTLDALIDQFGQSTERRRELARALRYWETNMRETGVGIKVWIGGSFLTTKPEPRDMDVIVWPLDRVYIGPNAECARRMFDVKHVYGNYGLDIHIEGLSNDEAFEREAHYLGFYGFGWDRRTPRTIAEITMEATQPDISIREA